jgi:NTE family protein
MLKKMFKTKGQKYDALVLSGGGMKGCALLGATAYLKDSGYLDGVHTYIGTSVGAIVAAALAIGLDPNKIFELRVLPFKYCPDVDIGLLDKSFGLDSGANLDKWLQTIFPQGLTFESVYREYHVTVVVVVSNLNRCHAEYLSRHTAPNMTILQALRMSCSVPVYFAAVVCDGMLYADGAVCDNFAMEHAHELGAKKILGVRFAPMTKAPGFKWAFDSFLGALLESAVVRREPSGTEDILNIDAGSSTHPLNFKMSGDTMRAMHKNGAVQAAAFMKKKL